MSPEYQKFVYWMYIEIVVFAAGTIINMAFLFIRSLFKEKITIVQANMNHNLNTDYLECQALITGMFITFSVPAFYL